MAIMVVTRLRLRSSDLLEGFLTASIAVIEQAQTAAGNLGADAMNDANDVWWTVTAWRDRAAIEAFTAGEPHHSTAAGIDHWCDEATFVDWEQADVALPDWQTCYEHLVADGQSATLTNASPAHLTRDYPPPVAP